jgi:hypothetical protein
MWQVSRTRNAVPPPLILFLVEEEAGRGKLRREKPVGTESESSAEVAYGVIQVSVRANRSI